MAKNLQFSCLLDIYGQLLTEKQRDAVELYYNEDLSLSEISEHLGITRQGVRDSIKRAENLLLDCEEKMGLAARFGRVQHGLEAILASANTLLGDSSGYSRKTVQGIEQIINLAKDLNNHL